MVEDFNKIQYYKICLKNPHAQLRTCSVGGLKLNERLLALIVTWILTPRESNYSILTKEDLLYIYCILIKVKINWIHIIKEHMKKSMRLSDYHYPYAILISKFLNYFEVNLEDETSELVKSTLVSLKILERLQVPRTLTNRVGADTIITVVTRLRSSKH